MPRDSIKGSGNPNWKGGITTFKKADDVLCLPIFAREIIKRKFSLSYKITTETGCWEWTKSIFNRSNRARWRDHLAARIMFVLVNNRSVGELLVCHTCDNTLCVNPKHLFLGTNNDNMKDMVAKGRAATGDKNGSRTCPEKLIRGDDHLNRKYPERVQAENNGRAQLTNDQVREIRKRYRPYVNNHKPSNRRELAKEFGVTANIITCIVKGKTWRTVK